MQTISKLSREFIEGAVSTGKLPKETAIGILEEVLFYSLCDVLLRKKVFTESELQEELMNRLRDVEKIIQLTPHRIS